MQPGNPRPESNSSTDLTATCANCKRRIAALTDVCLELAAANQRLAQVDEDLVDLIAPKRFKIYTLLGGTERTLGSYRAEVREDLRRGGDGFGVLPQ